MSDLPVELALKTVSTKVAPSAWERVDQIASKLGCRKSDVVSIALLFMDEDAIRAKLEEQARALNALPKAVRGLLRHMDKLDADQRKMVIAALSDDTDK